MPSDIDRPGDRPGLDQALRGRRRARRVLDLLEGWAMVGVMASALSADRQRELIGRLRQSPLQRTPDRSVSSPDAVSDALADFAAGRDMVVLVGWHVDEEPALLLSFRALIRALPYLRTVYPDGFVLLDQSLCAALLVDVDADDPARVRIDRLTLKAEGRQD
ncbi:hypothetical protein [Sphingomonas sp. PB1R3]|uniref:hypothetical protein n=1 Tax=Sphingomonas flavida TaxID=3096154 RepID=UPI002FCABA61